MSMLFVVIVVVLLLLLLLFMLFMSCSEFCFIVFLLASKMLMFD